MQRLKNALRDRRGETIVEVLVAFVLLMLFLALFTGVVAVCPAGLGPGTDHPR